MQHSRSSWDMDFPLETELPTTHCSLSLLSPHWRATSFCPAHFVPPIRPICSLLHTMLRHGCCSFLTHLAG